MYLKQHHIVVLRLICDRGAVPADELDGRMLRPFHRLGLIDQAHGVVRPTPSGRAALQRASSAPGPRGQRTPVGSGGLSEKQEEVLRYLLRQTGPVPLDHVDGRVFRALSSRGLVEASRGWVTATEHAEPYLREHVRKERELSLRRAASSARSARGETILRAVEQLEQALPRDAELMVQGHPAYADDLLAGLRRLVREMD